MTTCFCEALTPELSRFREGCLVFDAAFAGSFFALDADLTGYLVVALAGAALLLVTEGSLGFDLLVFLPPVVGATKSSFSLVAFFPLVALFSRVLVVVAAAPLLLVLVLEAPLATGFAALAGDLDGAFFYGSLS